MTVVPDYDKPASSVENTNKKHIAKDVIEL